MHRNRLRLSIGLLAAFTLIPAAPALAQAGVRAGGTRTGGSHAAAGMRTGGIHAGGTRSHAFSSSGSFGFGVRARGGVRAEAPRRPFDPGFNSKPPVPDNARALNIRRPVRVAGKNLNYADNFFPRPDVSVPSHTPSNRHDGPFQQFPVTGVVGGYPAFYPHDHHDRDIDAGSHFSGSYSDDHFNLRFNLGFPFLGSHDHHHRYPVSPFIPFTPGFGYFSYLGQPYYYNDYYYDPYIPIVQTTAYPAPALFTPANQPEAVPAAPLTATELAELAMQEGDPQAAADLYKQHIDDHPDDAEQIRSLALAYLDQHKLTEASALVAHAYELDPALASRPIDPQRFGWDRGDLRDNVSEAVRFAHASRTSAGWLLVTALMQAQGERSLAAQMLDRAALAGSLDPSSEREFRAALR